MAKRRRKGPRGGRKTDSALASVDKILQRAKETATPGQWSVIHDMQSRLATARGRRQKLKRGKAAGGTRSNASEGA